MSHTYKKLINFYETDAMKVVHHSNYLRFFEEARLSWLMEKGLLDYHSPRFDMSLAVIESQCKYRGALYFGDEIRIVLEMKKEGLKLFFRYVIYSDRDHEKVVATGQTVHLPLNSEHKICRLPDQLEKAFQEEIWTAIWP